MKEIKLLNHIMIIINALPDFVIAIFGYFTGSGVTSGLIDSLKN